MVTHFFHIYSIRCQSFVLGLAVLVLFRLKASFLRPTPADATRHINTVATQIRAVDPDILALQEVEDCDVLARLAAFFPLYRLYLVPGTDTATQQNVALLTKIDPTAPLSRTEERVSIPIPGSTCGDTTTGDTTVSKHLRAEFSLPSFAFTLIVAHFKSGGLPTDCSQREGQARILRSLMTPGRATVIAGDFNDFDEQWRDGKNKIGTSLTLRTLRGGDLVNVGSMVDQVTL